MDPVSARGQQLLNTSPRAALPRLGPGLRILGTWNARTGHPRGFWRGAVWPVPVGGCSGPLGGLACIIHENPDSTAKGRDRRRNGSRTSSSASGAGVEQPTGGGHDGREGWAATAPPAERPMPPRKQVGAAQRVGYPARAPSASAMCGAGKRTRRFPAFAASRAGRRRNTGSVSGASSWRNFSRSRSTTDSSPLGCFMLSRHPPPLRRSPSAGAAAFRRERHS